MKDKLATYLGFAIKSGNVVYGVDNIETKLSKVVIAIFDDRLGDNSVNKLGNLCVRNNTKMYKTIDCDLDLILATHNCKAIGITSKDLAKAIQELNILEEVRR